MWYLAYLDEAFGAFLTRNGVRSLSRGAREGAVSGARVGLS